MLGLLSLGVISLLRYAFEIKTLFLGKGEEEFGAKLSVKFSR